ncbi:PREDICTED: elicitor-responsive protein 3-like isoform X2 [Nelumbo nucifera]|uniref:Elicitor-responsive protein 3-like isoform X2 n=1 Tax=Nelumbo nucifera TaxID=4432 RepID=A0A1U8PYA8_NELNU|nr:PREDICTED: elicitor-responsive protein 3-like isoform X2 [Nelumbo nucifera]
MNSISVYILRSPQPAMSIYGNQGQQLEVTVVGCTKLKDTEWISRQDPYVCLEYGSTKYRTRTCTDGGKNPTFQEKFIFTLIDGLRELHVMVWNSNTLTSDDFIGQARIQLHKVLSQGYEDTTWPIQCRNGRYSGEVRLILHYPNANKLPATSYAMSATPLGAAISFPHPQSYYTSLPPPPATYAPSVYPPPPAGYPPQQYPTTTYTTQPYPPPLHGTPYPQAQYSGIYPPPPN